jgi:hypothetical protein
MIRTAFSILAAAGMAAVACDLHDVLIICIPAMIAAILVISAYRTSATAMCASVIDICHRIYLP